MNHRPFETWLYRQDELQEDQIRALQDHLETCPRCAHLGAGLQELEHRLRSIPIAVPAPGFTARWMERLEIERARLGTLQRRALTLGTTGGMFILIGTIGYQLLLAFQKALPVIMPELMRVVHLFTYLNLVREILGVILESLVQTLPISLRLGLPIGLALSAGIWVTSLYRLGFLTLRREA